MLTSSIDHRLKTIGDKLAVVHQRLLEVGFQFEAPSQAFPGTEPDHQRVVERIETEIGTVPLAVKLFWEIVGSVNFCGSHPDWIGCEYPDPIVVFPASVAEQELDEFFDDYDQRMAFDFPYLIPIAPDLFHKQDVSGGMWYNVDCPGVADDPPLNEEWHGTTFLQYLELCLPMGGFPGLAGIPDLFDHPDHNWPIAELTNKL